jgi:predicted nucleic acid-binding Zn ribbon protein
VRGSVTPTGRCVVCGEALVDRRSDALTCKRACRQKFYRLRQEYSHLTAERRRLLRLEIDLRRRERIARAGGYAAIEREERELAA